MNKNIIYTGLYFALAALLTFYFISGKYWLYNSVYYMQKSVGIAGSKWLIQVTAAFLFLKDQKWIFLKRISFICFIGSLTLYLYYLLYFLSVPVSGFSQFAVSIVCSVIVMTVMYYKAVAKTGLALGWFWGWMTCLTIAIMFQVELVFTHGPN